MTGYKSFNLISLAVFIFIFVGCSKYSLVDTHYTELDIDYLNADRVLDSTYYYLFANGYATLNKNQIVISHTNGFYTLDIDHASDYYYKFNTKEPQTQILRWFVDLTHMKSIDRKTVILHTEPYTRKVDYYNSGIEYLKVDITL